MTVALLALAAAPVTAQAASYVTSDGTTVTITGGPEANRVYGGGGLFMTGISDEAGTIAGPGCDQYALPDTREISCGQYQLLNADMGAGDDFIGVSLGPGNMGTVHGGPGNDEIAGDDGDSTLYGDDGNDKIFGSSGNDVIDGGPGIDQIFGDDAYLEPGADGMDTIYARDGQPDDISCGYGYDVVIADALDRVGSECDVVDRGTAPPPANTAVDPVTRVARIGPYASSRHTRGVTIRLLRDATVRVAMFRRVGGAWRRVRSEVVSLKAGIRIYRVRNLPHGVFRFTLAGRTAAGPYAPARTVSLAVRR